jgi:reverse gyrase
MIRAIFKSLCPNCDIEDINSERLEKGLACKKCMPDDKDIVRDGYLKHIFSKERLVEEINRIFLEYVKAPMWSLQRLWARRFFDQESFAMLAPTGSGKTTAQIILGVYAAYKMNKRVLYLLPTSLLAHQVTEKINELINMLGAKNLIVFSYHSYLKDQERREQLEKINNAKILVTTTMSLIKRPEIHNQRVDIVFVDDVDSFLRKSKSIDYVLKMIGVDEKLRKEVEELIDEERGLRKLIKSEPDKYEEELKRIISRKTEIRRREFGQIIVSGATQTTKKTRRILMLETLLGFSVGRRIEVGRKVVDAFIEPEDERSLEQIIIDVIRRLGTGGLVYVPLDKGSDYAEALEKILVENGIKAKSFTKSSRKIFEAFVSGEYDVLIGIASSRSPLVRGIDLPERVRYAVFAGVPKFKIKIDINEFHPTKWLILLNSIRDIIPREYQDEIDFIVGSLSNLRYLRKEDLEKIREAVKNGQTLEGFLEYARRNAERTLRFFERILSDKNILEAMRKSPYISLSEKRGEYVFVVPDVAAYIQASGRTSRLFAGGVTQGLSILIIDDVKAFNALMREMRWYIDEVSWIRFKDLDLDDLIRKIDLDRERVRMIRSGKAIGEFKDLIKTRLFIVESPNKARTIGRIFGRPVQRAFMDLQTYETVIEDSLLIITASGGHVLDLSMREGLFGVLIEKDVSNENIKSFVPVYTVLKKCMNCGRTVPEEAVKCPYCGSTVFRSVKNSINALRLLASQVDEVIIGTDPDSEGEKIAWDLYLLLKPFNKNIKRARFHEVTRKGILEALKNLEDINENMVKAQIVRRIEDRWIGYSLSPVLWREFNKNYLSAGRVQTPVLGFVVERSREASKKIELITIETEDGLKFIVKAPRGTYNKLIERGYVEVKDLVVKEEIVNPPPPFTTDTMLVAVTSALKISADKAMNIAQKLFEMGLITYHRTDSTTVSTFGMGIAKDYISNIFGEEYFVPRRWEMPGAHEGIRPTRPFDVHRLKTLIAAGIIKLQAPLTEEDLKVYDMIFRRFMASQMPPATVKRISFKLVVGDFEQEFSYITEILKPGFTLMTPMPIMKIEIIEGRKMLKNVARRLVGEKPLYTYSDLVSLMKDQGIGRPSTYATIIETLRRRGYIIEPPKARSRLVATKLGEEVYEYLSKNYSQYVSVNRTRELEKKMDLVEEGKADYTQLLNELYEEINEIITDAVYNKKVEYPNLNTDLIKH